ncbi:sigma-70 family RNA polymerase sigma factor [Pseudolactococcus yaeyamensis]
MKKLTIQEIEQLFDSYCKKVLKNKAYDIFRVEKHQQELFASLDALLERHFLPDELLCQPDFSNEEFIFPLLTVQLSVSLNNEALATALNLLKEENQEIILLHYFLSMTDEEIGARFQKNRITIQERRSRSLEKLRNILVREQK